MTKDPLIFVGHILDRIERILNYSADGEDAFHGDPKTQDAVIRSLEVIGEAAKRIPEPFREAHPTVPWRGFARMRDVLIHQYEGVDLLQVWRVVEDVLPEMNVTLSGILQQASSASDIGAQ